MDDQDEATLEEGELSDDSDLENGYIPLERPPDYSKTQPMPRLPVVPESESEEEIILSNDSDDSDSDPNSKKIKKPKIRLKPKPQQQQRTIKGKKYDIWSSRLQEDTLAATLDNCDVVTKDRSREVETYDFTLAHQYYNNEDNNDDNNRFRQVDRKNNKRTRDDRSNINFRQKQRSPFEDEEKRGEPNVIADLTFDKNSEAEDIAKEMACRLNEEKPELILKVITVLGKERSIEIFEETKAVEAEGGMLIQNRKRRRTPGGVFLYLVRNDYHITYDQRNEIFSEERQKFKQAIRNKRKEKAFQVQKKVAAAREKILPHLLTRAELLSTKNRDDAEEAGEQEDCVNPPPTPETDGCENSRDGMEGSPVPLINRDSLEDGRGKPHNYEDDFLDLRCGDDMDLF